MRFFEVVLSGAALVSAAFAVEFTSFPQGEIAAGEPVTLTYTPEDAATTIILRKGPSTDLDTLETLTTTSTGGSFTWNVPLSLEDGSDYAFEIRQEGAEPNYSGQFAISGGSAPAPTIESSMGYSTAESTSAAEETSTAEESSSAPATSSAAYTTMSTTAVPSASATISPSGSNSTISLGTPSATGTASPTSGEPPIENTGAASSFGVNAAALFGAVGASAYFV